MAKDDKTAEKSLSPEVQQIQDLYDVMLERGLDALELKDEDFRVKLTRRFGHQAPGGLVMHHAPASFPAKSGEAGARSESTDAQPDNALIIATPLAGVFYRASSPSSAPFVKDGDTVDAGQTLCIVEAMKVMNEIKAEARCRIVKIVAENGRPVTAGQALFQFEPA